MISTFDNLDNIIRHCLVNTTCPSGFKEGVYTGDAFDYDDYGNLIEDKNKGITAITYNHLNLPKKIEFGSTDGITYLYNANGQKIKKTVVNSPSVSTVNYQGAFHYENDSLRFIATAEGYVNFTTEGYNYVYNYTDHLGNIRLSYMNDRLLGLLILDETHYYPFGLKQKGYEPPPAYATSYKYKYQGQELQDELGLNWDSFKWRNYDYALGRFMSIDPLSEKYEWQSVYSFSSNQPVHAPEIEGLESSNDKSLMSRIADSFVFDIFRHQQDLKYAQTPQERTAIGNRIENSQARLETTGMVVQTYAYGTAAAGLAPWVAIGGAYA